MEGLSRCSRGLTSRDSAGQRFTTFKSCSENKSCVLSIQALRYPAIPGYKACENRRQTRNANTQGVFMMDRPTLEQDRSLGSVCLLREHPPQHKSNHDHAAGKIAVAHIMKEELHSIPITAQLHKHMRHGQRTRPSTPGTPSTFPGYFTRDLAFTV